MCFAVHQVHSFLFQRLTVILFIFLSYPFLECISDRCYKGPKYGEVVWESGRKRIEQTMLRTTQSQYEIKTFTPVFSCAFYSKLMSSLWKTGLHFYPTPCCSSLDLFKTDVLKARSESKASFFRQSVTEREGEYGSDCKPLTLPIFHEASCLPSCSHLACAFSWSPRWRWHVSAGCWAEIHPQAWKRTQGSCHVAHGSGASYVKGYHF